MKVRRKNLFRVMLLIITVFFLSSCGGSDSGGDGENAGAKVNGTVFCGGGFVRGADIYFDEKSDHVSSDFVGQFTGLPILSGSIIANGGTDELNGLPTDTKMSAPARLLKSTSNPDVKTVVITPLTTLLDKGATEDEIASFFDLNLKFAVQSPENYWEYRRACYQAWVLVRSLSILAGQTGNDPMIVFQKVSDYITEKGGAALTEEDIRKIGKDCSEFTFTELDVFGQVVMNFITTAKDIDDMESNYMDTYRINRLARLQGISNTFFAPLSQYKSKSDEIYQSYSGVLDIETGAEAPVAVLDVTDLDGNPMADKIVVGTDLIFDGSGSRNASYYEWILLEKPEYSTTAVDPLEKDQSDIMLLFDVSGTYKIRLTVSDGPDNSDYVDIIVKVVKTSEAVIQAFINDEPVVGTIEVVSGTSVTFSGKDSTGTGDLLYSWSIISQPDGSDVEVADQSAQSIEISGYRAGEYQFGLIVIDDNGPSDMIIRKFTVIADDELTADAGANKSVVFYGEDSTELDGSGSVGDISRLWEIISGPEGASIDDPTSVMPTFNYISTGTYVIKLTITGADEETDDDEVTIVVSYAGSGGGPVGIQDSILKVLESRDMGNGLWEFDISLLGASYQDNPGYLATSTKYAPQSFTSFKDGNYCLTLTVYDGMEVQLAYYHSKTGEVYNWAGIDQSLFYVPAVNRLVVGFYQGELYLHGDVDTIWPENMPDDAIIDEKVIAWIDLDKETLELRPVIKNMLGSILSPFYRGQSTTWNKIAKPVVNGYEIVSIPLNSGNLDETFTFGGDIEDPADNDTGNYVEPGGTFFYENGDNDRFWVMVRDYEIILDEGYVWPVNDPITVRFGEVQSFVIDGEPTSVTHQGIDQSSPKGTPIAVVNNGRVIDRQIMPETSQNPGLAIIVVEHPGGYTSEYEHPSAFADGIDIGSIVIQGDIIGFTGGVIDDVGSGLYTTGAHSHLTIKKGGLPIDPIASDLLKEADLE